MNRGTPLILILTGFLLLFPPAFGTTLQVRLESDCPLERAPTDPTLVGATCYVIDTAEETTLTRQLLVEVPCDWDENNVGWCAITGVGHRITTCTDNNGVNEQVKSRVTYDCLSNPQSLNERCGLISGWEMWTATDYTYNLKGASGTVLVIDASWSFYSDACVDPKNVKSVNATAWFNVEVGCPEGYEISYNSTHKFFCKKPEPPPRPWCSDKDSPDVRGLDPDTKFSSSTCEYGEGDKVLGTISDYCVDNTTVLEAFCPSRDSQCSYGKLVCPPDFKCENGKCVPICSYEDAIDTEKCDPCLKVLGFAKTEGDVCQCNDECADGLYCMTGTDDSPCTNSDPTRFTCRPSKTNGWSYYRDRKINCESWLESCTLPAGLTVKCQPTGTVPSDCTASSCVNCQTQTDCENAGCYWCSGTCKPTPCGSCYDPATGTLTGTPNGICETAYGETPENCPEDCCQNYWDPTTCESFSTCDWCGFQIGCKEAGACPPDRGCGAWDCAACEKGLTTDEEKKRVCDNTQGCKWCPYAAYTPGASKCVPEYYYCIPPTGKIQELGEIKKDTETWVVI